jgi:hypothetical protein
MNDELCLRCRAEVAEVVAAFDQVWEDGLAGPRGLFPSIDRLQDAVEKLRGLTGRVLT